MAEAPSDTSTAPTVFTNSLYQQHLDRSAIFSVCEVSLHRLDNCTNRLYAAIVSEAYGMIDTHYSAINVKEIPSDQKSA